MDYNLISDVELDGVDTKDYPDFCDAFICNALYNGNIMTDAQLEELNLDSGYVYDCVIESLQ